MVAARVPRCSLRSACGGARRTPESQTRLSAPSLQRWSHTWRYVGVGSGGPSLHCLLAPFFVSLVSVLHALSVDVPCPPRIVAGTVAPGSGTRARSSRPSLALPPPPRSADNVGAGAAVWSGIHTRSPTPRAADVLSPSPPPACSVSALPPSLPPSSLAACRVCWSGRCPAPQPAPLCRSLRMPRAWRGVRRRTVPLLRAGVRERVRGAAASRGCRPCAVAAPVAVTTASVSGVTAAHAVGCPLPARRDTKQSRRRRRRRSRRRRQWE